MANTRIHSVQFSADQKLLDFIEKKTDKLNQYFDNIIDTEVYLKLDEKSSQLKDKTVEIKINLPGSQLFAKSTSKQFEKATDESISSIKRQLKKYKEKLRS